jgi:hypothetical protein
MNVARLDGKPNGLQIQGPIYAEFERLRLNSSKYCAASSFIFIGMRLLPGNILIASATMGK